MILNFNKSINFHNNSVNPKIHKDINNFIKEITVNNYEKKLVR